MMFFIFLFIVFFYSCGDDSIKIEKSIHSYIDNEISGDVRIEIFNKEKPSIYINSDNLHQYDAGNTLLFGGVYADLYNDDGSKGLYGVTNSTKKEALKSIRHPHPSAKS